MTYRTLRRRLSEATAAHDWLEGLSFVAGLVFFALALICVWAMVISIASIGDPESPPGMHLSLGSLDVTRAFSIVLFAVLGFLSAGIGWFLGGHTIKRWVRRARARD